MKNSKEIEKHVPLSKEQVVNGCYVPMRRLLNSCNGSENFEDFMLMVRETLMEDRYHNEMIIKMLNEIILGAYHNRAEMYGVGFPIYSLDDRKKAIKIRQSTDNHLLNVIKARIDIMKPIINVSVKRADQVNVANQQVNVSKPSNNLDKK